LTTDYGETAGSDFALVIVNTDFDRKRQQLTINALEKALEMVGKSIPGTTAVVLSTLPYGASKTLKPLCTKHDIDYCYAPIMINQGNYIDSFLKAPFIVFGADPEVGRRVLVFYAEVFQIFQTPLPPTYIVPPATAELTKLVANAFLSTKMTFANYMGELCEQLNQRGENPPLDANLILHIIGNDPRIGHRYLRAAFAFGGGCFPRDLKALITSCQESGTDPEILKATDAINARRTLTPITALQSRGLLSESKTIAILGTAYKAGIDDERGSKALEMAEQLERMGHTILKYDPNIPRGKSLADILKEAEIVIVTTDERKFEGVGSILSERCIALCDFSLTSIVDRHRIPEGISIFKAGRGWTDKQDE